MVNAEDKAIKTFVTTRRTFIERRLKATRTPTHENHKAFLKADFALSLAKIRVLRLHDKHGHMVMNAIKDLRAAKQALISFDPSPDAIQTSLFTFTEGVKK